MVARTYLASVLFIVVQAVAVAPACAYEEIDVVEGGQIAGQVLFRGTPPQPGTLAVTKHQEICGSSKPDESLIVGSQGGLKNAIITVETISRGKKVDKTAKPYLDNHDCQFVPHVQAVSAGARLEIRNSDAVLHNTHGSLLGRTAFNLALPLKGQKVEKVMRRSGLVHVTCDAGHTWMSAYVLVAENPYFAVSDDNGRFEIKDVPPGKYKLKAWHEKLGTELADVDVTARSVSEVSFSNLKP